MRAFYNIYLYPRVVQAGHWIVALFQIITLVILTTIERTVYLVAWLALMFVNLMLWIYKVAVFGNSNERKS